MAALLALTIVASNYCSYIPLNLSVRAEDNGEGEGEGNGGGDTITNNYYTYNNEYNYYFFDVGLQFTPRVGSIFSINTNPNLMYLGSSAGVLKDGSVIGGNGTAWRPQKEDLPDIFGSLGLTFRYAALYDGYWNATDYRIDEDIPNTPGQPSVPITGTKPDAAERTFERSWSNRNPGYVLNDKDEPEEWFGTDRETGNNGNGSMVETDNSPSMPSWMRSGYGLAAALQAQINANERKLGPYGGSHSTPSPLLTDYSFYEWYRDTDVVKTHQDLYNPDLKSAYAGVLSDDVQRALNILGEDILLRDEWVASCAYPYEIHRYYYPSGEPAPSVIADMYYYAYSNTSVLDPVLSANEDLLTQDYVLQSIYRTLGINCLRSDVFLYSDKYHTVNNTPLATQLTVAIDKINQIQNRMDVFVTRANLDKYWEKALTDGLVFESGRNVPSTVGASYKPQQTPAAGGVVEQELGSTRNVSYDAARNEHLSLAEFCYILTRAMNIYGEEVITQQEKRALLAAYGAQLPYYLPETQLNAIEYLMAKGIVSNNMGWSDYLTVEDMLIILSRVKDPGSRLTFKDISLNYNLDLLDAGYYPADINVSFTDKPLIEAVSTSFASSSTYKDAVYYDFLLKLDDTWKWDWKDSSGNELSQLVLPKNVNGTWDVDHAVDGMRNGMILDLGNTKINGVTYRHIRINRTFAINNSSNGYININTPNAMDDPQWVQVPYYGGVFNEFTTNKADNGLRNVTYTSGNTSAIAQIKPNTFDDISSLNVTIDKRSDLMLYGYDPYGALDIADDGLITKAHKLVGTSPLTNNAYSTFNDAGFGVQYVDHERWVMDYAVQLSKNPYLSSNQESIISGIVDKYDAFIFINETAGNLHYRKDDVLGSDFVSIRMRDSQNKLLKTLEFAGELYGKAQQISYIENVGYWIKVSGNYSAAELQQNLLMTNGNYMADIKVTTIYAKQQDTFLVPLSTINDFLMSNINQDMLSVRDLSITDLIINDKGETELYCLSGVYGANWATAEADKDAGRYTAPFTILIDTLFHRICVNNIVYDVPEDELLLIKNNGNVSTDYLINWRAFQSWFGNFEAVQTASSGGLVLSFTDKEVKGHAAVVTGGNTVDAEYSVKVVPSTVRDAWTKSYYDSTLYKFTVTAAGETKTLNLFPLHAPYIQSTFLLHIRNGGNSILYNTKNTLDKSKKSESTFANAEKDLTDTFAITVADDVLVTAMRLDTSTIGSKYITGGWDALARVYGVPMAVAPSGYVFYNTEIGTYFYVLPTKSLNVNGYKPVVTSQADLLSDADNERVLEAVNEFLSSEDMLPLVSDLHDSDNVYSIICNMYDGYMYGTVPGYAIAYKSMSKALKDMSERNASLATTILNWSTVDTYELQTATFWRGSIVTNDENRLTPISVLVSAAPTGLPFSAMHVPSYTLSDIFIPGYQVTSIMDGNILGYCEPKMENNKVIGIHTYTNAYYARANDDERDKYVEAFSDLGKTVQLVCGSGSIQYVNLGTPNFRTIENYKDIADNQRRRNELVDADQPGKIDWGKYTFDTLIHDIDNGTSILLIIVLNILPRIGMFIFLLLITLATIANIKPWRQFCTNVFDPYKLFTFGHASVDTVKANSLLVTSIIGLAVFALFMDGTLIHVLTWITQFVMKMIKS